MPATLPSAKETANQHPQARVAPVIPSSSHRKGQSPQPIVALALLGSFMLHVGLAGAYALYEVLHPTLPTERYIEISLDTSSRKAIALQPQRRIVQAQPPEPTAKPPEQLPVRHILPRPTPPRAMQSSRLAMRPPLNLKPNPAPPESIPLSGTAHPTQSNRRILRSFPPETAGKVSDSKTDNTTELQLPGRNPNRYARSHYTDSGKENSESSRTNYGAIPGTGLSRSPARSSTRQDGGATEAAGDPDSGGGPIRNTGGRRGPRRGRSGRGDGPFLPAGDSTSDTGLPDGNNALDPPVPGKGGNRTNSRVSGGPGDPGEAEDGGFRGSRHSGRSGLPTYNGSGGGDTGAGASGDSQRNTRREQAGNGNDNEFEGGAGNNDAPPQRPGQGRPRRNPRLASNAFDNLPASDAGPDTNTSRRSNDDAGTGGSNEKGGLIGKPDVVVPEEIKNRGPQVLTVVLLVDVSAEGQITNVVVEKSSGHKVQDAEAVKACWNTRYKPRKRNGQPVATQIRVPIKIRVE